MRKIFTLFALCLIGMSTWAAEEGDEFDVDSVNYMVTSISPATVKVGDNTGFTGTSVTIPATVTYESTEYTVTAIGEQVFSESSSLETVTIPATVTSIGDYAFYYCSNLSSVTFAAGSQLINIGVSAFELCESLESITIPATVETIGENAFYGCALTSITIPASVKSIGDAAFADCGTITATCLPTTPPTILPPVEAETPISIFDENSKTYVPLASLGTYNTDASWKDYSPKSSVTLNGSGYATFSSFCDVTLQTGLSSYKATSNDGTKVYFAEVGSSVPANTGVLLTGKASTAYDIEYTTGVAAVTGTNIFVATDGVAEQKKDDYILNGNKFWKLAANGVIAACKAYIPKTPAGKAQLEFEFGEPTSVNDIQEANSQVQRGKYIENGHIVILQNNKKFNLAGQSLN